MPTRISLPPCLKDCCEVLFPTIDWPRVAFFTGLPTGVDADDHKGITMASWGEIHVYLREDAYDPCEYKTFLLVAHELVHVLQAQEMTGGGRFPGSWQSYYMSHSACAGFKSGCRNKLEREAYEYSKGCGEKLG